MTIISILLILGALHGVLLALFLLTSRSEARVANRYLAALVLLFSLVLFETDLFINEFIHDEDFFRILTWPKEFLYGTLLYFYTRELVFPNQYPLKNKQWLHFLPAMLHIALTWPLLFLNSARENIFFGSTNTMTESVWKFLLGDFEDIAGIFHVGLYLFLSLRLLHKHRLFLQNNYSYIDKINLNWLRFIFTATGFLWLIWIGSILILNDDFISSVLDICIVVLIYLMGYVGLKHPVVYNQMVIGELPDKAHQTEASTSTASKGEKYQNSALSFDQSLLLLEEIEQLMQEKKPYLDSKLSLPTLAKRFNISGNYLSQVLNEQKQQNFFDYINGYRIEDAKRRLLDPQKPNEKILTIAMDAGFNSKSSFYTAFRRVTGHTPRQYKDLMK